MNNQNNDIKSVSDFINTVVSKTNELKNKELDQNIFWFRGEGNNNCTCPLVPKSYRILAESFHNSKCYNDKFESDNIKRIEHNIKAEFYRKALPFMTSKKIKNKGWNQYFLMQHYKISTRLLDWTENALIALFFTICDSNLKKDDAVVWILQPALLNNFTIQNITGSNDSFYSIIPGIDTQAEQSLINSSNELRLNELTRRYLWMDFINKEEENLKSIYYPLAMYPPYLDERMSAQQSCFTIFGNKINGLLSIDNNSSSEFLNSIKVSSTNKNTILNELKMLGINYCSIYPDLDGLGQSINSNFENSFYNNSETIVHVLDEIINTKKGNNQ